MGITPKDPADFDPSMGEYKDLKPFRFWCQKVLPLVYDDSLSYYEVLSKLVDYLNKTMEDVDTLHVDVDALHEAYQQLESYVNDYFESLDVQEEINNKLNSMVEDGTFDRLLLPLFAQIQAEVDGQNQTITQQNSRISVLEQRMDTFSHLAEGSTTGDAELADIRVGGNGVTYPTAGDAVRAQYGINHNELVGIRTGADGVSYDTAGEAVNTQFSRLSSVVTEAETALSAEYPNIWNCTYNSDSGSGITLTKQDDGTYTVSGTATSLFYKQQTITLPPGRYRINGFTGGSTQSYHLMITGLETTYYQFNGWSNELTLETETTLNIYLRVLSGTTIDTTFKPIIVNSPDYITQLDYIPYQFPYYSKTVNEKIADQADITGYVKPNLFNNLMRSQIVNGITYTVNDDGSVSMSGISTALSYISQAVTLPRGKYIVNGCNDGGSVTYHIMIIRTGEYFVQYGGVDKAFEITEDTETFQILCRVVVGTQVNTTMYPMIRSASVYNPQYAPYGKYQIYKPIQKLINYTQFNWSGKNINVIGDSIVQGGYGNFIIPIRDILNLNTARNYGVGGCCMASTDQDEQYPPVVLRYSDMDLDAQIIVVHAGTNDYSHQVPLGDPNSSNIETFNGALNTIMTGLRGMYPTALIIFDSILHRYNDGQLAIKASQYRQAIEDRCLANHIVFYDCYKYSGFDFVQGYYDHILTPDGLHLNQTGANILGRKLAGFINWN